MAKANAGESGKVQSNGPLDGGISSKFGKTDVSGSGMTLHPFKPGNAGSNASQLWQRLSSDRLPSYRFQKLMH